jgi:hypothetical protein
VPPSPYVPFIRRFTDERARDLADTIALYNEVRAAHAKSVWAKDDAVERVSSYIVEQLGEIVALPSSPALAQALDRCQMGLLALETTIFSAPQIDWNVAVLSLKEQVDLRRFLRAQQHFLANEDRVADLLVTALGNVCGGIISELPELSTASDSAFTVPLIALVSNVADVVDRIIGTLINPQLLDAGLFAVVHERLYDNVCLASGIPPHEDRPRKPFVMPHQSDLPPMELVQTYLGGTPFVDLFLTPVAFVIPVEARFEHTHIVAGIGHGKTQLMQTMMLADFEDASRPAVVAIDSQGDMIRTLSRLDCFNPSHDDRLIILDPADTEWPLKLNLFDVNRSRLDQLPRGQREQILAGIIELYEYIFGALLGSELTAKQSVVFRFLAQLMLAIPNANIHTLRLLLEDPTPFLPYLEQLPTTARSFLNNHLFAPKEREYTQTRKQVLRRLYDILSNPTFERMFSHPRNALDMKRVLDDGKVVLVNTAKDVLKSEASATFGRFVIALILQAALERAADPIASRRPAFVYVDEAADYFDDNIDTLLIQARKYKVGLTVAHQFLDQLTPALRASVMTNPAIRFAGGVSDKDARALASDMRTTSSFLMGTRKRKVDTEFACYVRNHTGAAFSLNLPLGRAEREPHMTAADFTKLRDRVRAEVAAPIAEVDALIAAAIPSATMVHQDATTFADEY